MSAYRKAVKEHSERAEKLGHVPRSLQVPDDRGSVSRLRTLLEQSAHKALLRRITSS